MDMKRKRSVVWDFFKYTDPQSVQCVLCESYTQKRTHGSTTSMLKHLRFKHPTEVSRKSNRAEPPASGRHQDLEADGDQLCSVEVVLEDGDSDIMTAANETDECSTVNGVLKTSQESPPDKITQARDYCLVTRTRHKRSLIWRYFQLLDSLDAARCRICMKTLQVFEGTSNLRRHMLSKHPKVYSELVAGGKHPTPLKSSQDSSANGETDETVRATAQRQVPVEVVLEDGDSDIMTAVNETDECSTVSDVLKTSQEGPADQVTQARDDCLVTRTRHKRSLIWRHFERLDSLNAARCRMCMKKLQCFEGTSSNLRRHMLKRHPKVYSEVVLGSQHPTPLKSSHDSSANGETDETVRATAQRWVPGALKDSRTSERESRTFKVERELIEALRRTQKEEAQTLEHQRELLEKLRATNAREAAAEREKIESLRKAQQEEAESLSRQKEELQKEKAELQKKWEEFHQEREQLLSFS